MAGKEITPAVVVLAYQYIAPILYILGLVGSLANLIILHDSSKFSSRFYVYLKSLAVGDLLFIVFIVPYFTRQLSPEKDYSSSWSQLIYQSNFELQIANAFLAASVFIVVCMTIDR